MDNATKGILVVLGLAGVGILAAVLLRPKAAGNPPTSRISGTLTALPEPSATYEQYQLPAPEIMSTEPATPETTQGIENYSVVTWTDPMGNEREMVSRRVIH